MNPEKKDAYDYTLQDFESYLGCPQCGARKLLNAVTGFTSDYSRGQERACLEVLLHDHECGKEE